MLHVLLIDDEPKTAQSVKSFLNENQMNCDIAYNVENALTKIQQKLPDILITDVVMPGISGLEFVQSLRQKQIHIPILMISALGETDHKITGLGAGADDYLAKPFHLNELLARIQALIRRSHMQQNMHETQIIRYEDLELNLVTLQVTRSMNKIVLTPKEFSLLEYFVRNKERVIPKIELLEKIWGLGDEINTNVVEVFVNYLRKKIDKNYESKLIHTHFGIGYFLKKTESEE